MQGNKEFSATAITLKTFEFGDYDKIYSFFSKEFGIVKALAKGIKKSNNKFGGRLDVLNVNELIIRKGRNLGTITDCETYKNFPLLRLDYDKLVYSLYIAELILIFCHEDEPAEELFNLLLFTLENIEKTDNTLIQTLWFQVHFLDLLGYQPNFTNCDICLEDILELNKRLGLSLNTGSVICESCLKKTHNYKLIDDEILKILKILKEYDLVQLEKFKPDIFSLEKIQEILKEYFSKLSERKIKTLSVFD